MAADLDYSKYLKRNSCIFCWDDQIISWKNLYIQNLVKMLYHFLKSPYGYAFQSELKKGPIFYPWGILAGLGHSEQTRREREKITLWGITALASPDDSDYQTPRTSDPHPAHKVYPYALRGLSITRPNHVWCTDITYIPLGRGFFIPGGYYGLGKPEGSFLAPFQHNGYKFLH